MNNLVAVLTESGMMPHQYRRTYRQKLGLSSFPVGYSEMATILRSGANQNYVARLPEWRSDVFIRWDESEQAFIHSERGENFMYSSPNCTETLYRRQGWIIYRASDHAIYTAIEQQEKHKDYVLFGE